MIEVLSNGALNAVQDRGRPDHLGLGVSRSGAMDVPALEIANLLVGNEPGAAGIEICIFPFRVRFHQDSWLACAGAITTLKLPRRNHSSWWAVRIQAGDVLTVEPPQLGSRVLLAVQGGIAVESVLGSQATDLKSGFGGLQGRGLRKGDRLAVGSQAPLAAARSLGVAPASRRRFADQLASGTVTIRTVAGAEYEQFTEDAQAAFSGSDYLLTPECNRQGYRLDGAGLPMRQPTELLSHGIVPGTVQVPPSGQPIVQMAEANTIGGYPKIATVIEADLWRLAQLRPGQRIRFEFVDHAGAVAALRAHRAEQDGLRDTLAMSAASD